MMNERNKIIAIIPARGGSKRLLKKNVLPLLGRPLIEYSIKYAKSNLDYIDKIVVTTDDEEIKQIAINNNVEVINRPKNISGEHATTVSALKHVLNNVKEEYEYVLLLQPTNPLRPVNLLNELCAIINDKNCDSIMTVSRNADKLGKIVNNKFKPFNYIMGQRSQDLEPLYSENGLIYLTKSKYILKDIILAENNYPYVIDHAFSKVDIDTIEDFKYAEFLLKNNINE